MVDGWRRRWAEGDRKFVCGRYWDDSWCRNEARGVAATTRAPAGVVVGVAVAVVSAVVVVVVIVVPRTMAPRFWRKMRS